MMIERANSEGGLLGRKIEAVVVDTASDPQTYRAKATELLDKHDVDVIFGGYSSAYLQEVKGSLRVHDGLLFYPSNYQGQEAFKHIYYSGTVPNHYLPLIEKLATENQVERWVLEGTEGPYSKTLNDVILAYLLALGFGEEAISINYTPFGDTVSSERVEDIKAHIADRKAAIFSTVAGDPNVLFYTWLADHQIISDTTTVVSATVDDLDLEGFNAKVFANTYLIQPYFVNLDVSLGGPLVPAFRDFTSNKKITSSPAMHAHFTAFSLWVEAVRAAGTTDTDPVRQALYDVVATNSLGTPMSFLPNNHTSLQMYSGRVDLEGEVVDIEPLVQMQEADAWSDWLEDSKNYIADWMDESIQCEKFNVTTDTCEDRRFK